MVYFTWTNNSGTGKAANMDKAVLVAYSADAKQTSFITNTAIRSAGAATFDVTNFKGITMQTWIAFLSDDGKEASNSFYTGELDVS